MNEKLIGHIGVDSGQMLLCDPCYIDNMWSKSESPKDFRDLSSYEGKFNYLGSAQATLSDKKAGILDMSVAAVCSTGWGDGLYPVYVTYEGDRISEMRIVFIAEDEEKDENICEECNEYEDTCDCNCVCRSCNYTVSTCVCSSVFEY